MCEERPAYYRLYADAWDELNANLSKAQAAKLLYAMAAYFFSEVEPAEWELPKPARALFNIQRSQIANYRKNALNGRKASQKVDRKLSESSQLFDQVSTQELMQEIEGSQPQRPAETQNLGGKPPAKGAAKGPANIINHKSLIINTYNQPRVVTGAGSERATAGAAMERPAAALPTRAEYERISRKLETEGLDAITPEEREAYHAGHTAYAAT